MPTVRLTLLLTALLASLPVGAGAPPNAPVNALGQRDKPYLVLVSIDGFRWDYPSLVDTPALDRMAAAGLKAEALQPVFPTQTFPNHFSIATGLPPAQHGLVGNDFPDESRTRWYHYKDRATVQDGDWYLAEPIWVTAARQGMVTAAYYFVGTEAPVGGVRPDHWRAFDSEVPPEQRVRQVLDWLAEPPASRPHVITLYFEQVDDHSHWSGPGSAESLRAIRDVDRQLGVLLDGIGALPHGDEVYVLVVSDHGNAAYLPDREPLVLDRLVDLDGVRAVEGGPFVHLYFPPGAGRRAAAARDLINAHWDCGRALLPEDAPAAWNVSASPRFPDLIVLADRGCAVLSTPAMAHKITQGDHGWAPEVPEMRGIFYAVGPRIPPGARPGVLQVTDIHPLMLSILGLEASCPPGHVAGAAPDPLSALLLPATP
jgi:predicted AlkP superfamily pyrophosphatase or phosphodiesterase